MKLTDIQPEKELRAAIYLRVSTTTQADEEHYGLDVQEERSRTFCKSQGYTLNEGHIYTDKMSGGTKPEARPGLTALLQAAERKEFDYILVYKIDRLARNLKIFLGIVEHLDFLKVGLRSVTEPIDTSTPIGEMVMQILAMFAQFERGMIRERTMNGKVKAAETGKWVTGVPPYGYKVDKQTKKLILIPEQAKNVRRLFNWVVDDRLPLREVERKMNQLKIPAPYKARYKNKITHDHWHRRTIGRILTNEVYTGTYYYRKYKRPFNNLTSITDKRKLRPKEEWIEMQTEPVISREMFEAAKLQLLHNREFAERNRKREYLYSKLIFCSRCNHKMFGGFQPPKKKWEYAGGRYYHGIYRNDAAIGKTARCEWCPIYSEARLEPIWECLKEILQNPKNMLAPLGKYIHKEVDQKKTDMRLGEIAIEIDSVKDKSNRTNELYIEQKISKKEYNAYNEAYRREIQKLEDEATRLKQTLLTKKEVGEREQSIQKAFKQIQSKLENVSYEDKTSIIHFFIERITLHAKEDYAEVVFKFPQFTEAKQTKVVSQEGKWFPLVLHIKTTTEAERRAFMLKVNPGMYIPKTLV